MATVARTDTFGEAISAFQASGSSDDWDYLVEIGTPAIETYLRKVGQTIALKSVWEAIREQIGEYPGEGGYGWLMSMVRRALVARVRANRLSSGPAKLDLDALLAEHEIPESDRHNFRLLQAGIIQDPQFRRKLEGEYAGCYQAMLDKLSEPFAHLYPKSVKIKPTMSAAGSGRHRKTGTAHA